MLTPEELSNMGRKDPFSFALLYIDLLDGKKWDISNRKWLPDIYNAVNPWEIEKYPAGVARKVAIIKSTQAGISTTGLSKTFHFATNWPGRVGYTLPRQQDVLDMVTTRVDPMIARSPYLKEKLGEPNSVHAKGIADSFIYFMEMSVEPRMLPLDMMIIDEVDLSDPSNMSTALNRMDASKWGMAIYLSTPTVSNYGIDSLYKSTDMRRWLVKCPKCGEQQPLDWDVNLKIKGAQSNPDRVWYGCKKCSAELTIPHIQTGKWVAEKPSLSDTFIGFHVSQMLTTPAPVLYSIFRDPQTKIVEFYRKRLGVTYEIGGGSIDRDDILSNCFDETISYESHPDGKSRYYIAVDQGNELQVMVAKIEPDDRYRRIVHIERIPMDEGFARLSQLCSIYKVRGIIDANPNRHSSMGVSREFRGRILVADYIENQKTMFTKKKRGTQYFNHVTINRTQAFDDLIESIRNGEWILPGGSESIRPEVELVIDQVTSIKRDVEERKQGSSTVQVAVWRSIRADHFAHVWAYLNIAMDIFHNTGVRVGIAHDEDSTDEESSEDRYVPPDEIVKEIISNLAEVPADQLSGWVENNNAPDYVAPFPLSAKLEFMASYDVMDILYCIMVLLDDDAKKKENMKKRRRRY